jgi:hypothetical protein
MGIPQSATKTFNENIQNSTCFDYRTAVAAEQEQRPHHQQQQKPQNLPCKVLQHQ